jgi:hypothetical protein
MDEMWGKMSKGLSRKKEEQWANISLGNDAPRMLLIRVRVLLLLNEALDEWRSNLIPTHPMFPPFRLISSYFTMFRGKAVYQHQ